MHRPAFRHRRIVLQPPRHHAVRVVALQELQSIVEEGAGVEAAADLLPALAIAALLASLVAFGIVLMSYLGK